ncbi:MAG: TolC family protein [Ignavibacteriales bacterium]|nr:TolC family protein [Ignavibacteriales bacterium]
MKTITVTLALLVAGFSSAVAQVKMLTIEESVNIGIENSRVLHAAQMKSEYAGAKASEMSAMLYPSLKVMGSYQRLSEVPAFTLPLPGAPTSLFPYIPNSYNLRASFQQPLFTGWKFQGAADNAAFQAEASRIDVAKERAELVFNIKSAYWNLYRVNEMKRLTDENVKQVSSHLEDVENLVKQGMATTNDVLKVRVQLSNSKILQSDAGNAVRLAMISLNSTIGIPLGTDVGIASPLTATTREFPELAKTLASALGTRPEVLGMESRVKAAGAAVTSAVGGWFPQIFLTGNYNYARPNQRIIPAKDEFKDTWDVGLSVQFDLWNNLTALHQTNQAKAQLEQTKDALVTLKDGITLEVTQSYLNFQQAKERIRLSELTVDQANENYRTAAEKYKAGLTSSSELLDAEVALLQSKLQLTQSLVDHELAEARLEKALGELR